MLIVKLNRMIRNRVVWTIFALVVGAALLGFIGPSYSCRRSRADAADPGTEGRMYGKAISDREFNEARFYELGMNERNAPDTVQGSRALRHRVWKRIAALSTAASLGISVSDEEIGQMIGRDPSFSVGGAFNRQRYETVVQNQLRVNLPTFEAYLRQSMLLRKLADLLKAAVWIAPAELQERLANLTDTLSVEYAVVGKDSQADRVEVSRADAEAFFAAHAALFEIPEMVSVKYVSFPFTNYFDPDAVPDADVAEYYDYHSEDFSATATNGTNVATTPLPFADVKDDIRARLARKEAASGARDAATDFALELIPDRAGNALDFSQAAAKMGLTISTTALFSAFEPVPGIDADQNFTRTAFRLDPSDPERAVSDAISGASNTYVITLHQRREARIPSFDEVQAEVMPAAVSNAEHAVFLERAQEIRNELAKAVSEGASFPAAAAASGLNVSTTASFTVYENLSSNTFKYADRLIPLLASMHKGDVSEPVETTSGVVVAHLANRAPGEILDVQTLRPELLSALENYRAGIAFDDWCEYLLTQSDFKDFRPIAERAESETEGESTGEPTNEPSSTPSGVPAHAGDLL